MVLFRSCLLLAVFAVAAISAHREHEYRWSEAAWKLLEKECPKCIGLKSDARLYISRPRFRGGIAISARARAFFLDPGYKSSSHHDSVLVVDPTPYLRVGHAMFIFFLDRNVSHFTCKASGGTYLEGGDCLSQWFQPNCYRRKSFRLWPWVCDITFPPEVRIDGTSQDILGCSDIWSPCPEVRVPGNQSECHPLMSNHMACNHNLRQPCNPTSTCNHAVILSGGFNKQLTNQETFENVRTMNTMLKRNGFSTDNIKIFYGNGLNSIEKEFYEEDLGAVFTSTMKAALRYYLSTVCDRERCANSLFIYLNSPATIDGSAVLWDFNSNGQMDAEDLYDLEDMLKDIGHCKARRVVIVIDQSFSSELIKLLDKGASNHTNTIVFAPADDDDKNSLVNTFGDLDRSQCLLSFGPVWTGSHFDNVTLSGEICGTPLKRSLPSSCQPYTTLEKLEDEQLIL